MRRKIAAATAVTVAVGAATMIMVVVAPSASAAEQLKKASRVPGADCPIDAVCLYTEKKFRGSVLVDRRAKGKTSYGRANDTFSSIINRSQENICFFRDEDFQGPALLLRQDRSFPDLQLWGDALSSHHRASVTPCK
jgi:hypothetical protein